MRLLAIREPILVSDLTKVFIKNKRPFLAVNNLSFGVSPTDCFGLLGLNGAGKTTTIEILTGQLDLTSGRAYVNGHDIKEDRIEAIRSLGYCPQFDYLPEYLTSRESLELYANLRGLKENVTNRIIDDFINAFKLNEFESKLVQNLRSLFMLLLL
jgi:ATP-binding cassette subfamily A (ABC1) protein 3